ncbi:hypothetical protein SNEBB_004877 [Seison nebaliae]|nr:hypothetical protein SNEBB_004877 [Seison nebaliae]
MSNESGNSYSQFPSNFHIDNRMVPNPSVGKIPSTTGIEESLRNLNLNAPPPPPPLNGNGNGNIYLRNHSDINRSIVPPIPSNNFIESRKNPSVFSSSDTQIHSMNPQNYLSINGVTVTGSECNSNNNNCSNMSSYNPQQLNFINQIHKGPISSGPLNDNRPASSNSIRPNIPLTTTFNPSILPSTMDNIPPPSNVPIHCPMPPMPPSNNNNNDSLNATGIVSSSNRNIPTYQPHINPFPPTGMPPKNMPSISNVPSTLLQPKNLGMPQIPNQLTKEQMSTFPPLNSLAPLDNVAATPSQPPKAQFRLSHLLVDDYVNLMDEVNVIPDKLTKPVEPPLGSNVVRLNTHPSIMRCTLNAIPNEQTMLDRCRLPFAVMLHPFKDVPKLDIIENDVIVRCAKCRSYINPFITYIDNDRWRCNMCNRMNCGLPASFLHNQNVQARREIRFASHEFIASAEYAPKPSTPALYLILLDVSHAAVNSGYLEHACEIIEETLSKIPGDKRRRIGIIPFDRYIHLLVPSLKDGDDNDFCRETILMGDELLACPLQNEEATFEEWLPIDRSKLLIPIVNNEKKLIKRLIQKIPKMYGENQCLDVNLSAALKCGVKLLNSYGGRITIFLASRPTIGEDIKDQNRIGDKKITENLLLPSSFYKSIGINVVQQQISIDAFAFNSTFSDLISINEMCRLTSGQLYYYESFTSNSLSNNNNNNNNKTNIVNSMSVMSSPVPKINHNKFNLEVDDEVPQIVQNEMNYYNHYVRRFREDLRRYLSRKIGFEAVLRLRCSSGLKLRKIYGNGFMRAEDLLQIPVVSPDNSYAIQIDYKSSNLENMKLACFQSALLFSGSDGQRRIRVHTMVLPITNNLFNVIECADPEAIIFILTRMAIERSINTSLKEAKESLSLVLVDFLSAVRQFLVEEKKLSESKSQLVVCPKQMATLALYVHALQSHPFFTPIRLSHDQRTFYLSKFQTIPLRYLLLMIYPSLYELNCLEQCDDQEWKIYVKAFPPHYEYGRSVKSKGESKKKENGKRIAPICSYSEVYKERIHFAHNTEFYTEDELENETEEEDGVRIRQSKKNEGIEEEGDEEDDDENDNSSSSTDGSETDDDDKVIDVENENCHVETEGYCNLENCRAISLIQPKRISLTYRNINENGLYLLDTTEWFIIYVGTNVSPSILQSVFNVNSFNDIPNDLHRLPLSKSKLSSRINRFIDYLQSIRPFHTPIKIVKARSSDTVQFVINLLDDKSTFADSYYGYLRTISERLK